jgi:hypothetical protein
MDALHGEIKGVIAQLEHDANDIVCIEYEGMELLLHPEKIRTAEQIAAAARAYRQLYGCNSGRKSSSGENQQ